MDGDGKGGLVVLPYSPNFFPQCLIVFDAPSRKGIGIVVAPFQELHKKAVIDGMNDSKKQNHLQ